MRGLTLPVSALLALVLLAGCNEAPPEATVDGEPADDQPRRTARGGSGPEDEEEEPELEPVELLRTPLTMAGQGPESFDLTVPEGIVEVSFEFSNGQALEESGLRIELTGCGSYDGGLGSSGSVGGVSRSGDLCGEATPGPATVTISATLLAFDGTFALIGFTPAGNATAPASNGTAAAG